MIALITGASRGIGRELVPELADRGVDVVFALSRNASRLQKLGEEMDAHKPMLQYIPLVFDLESPSADFQKLADRIADHANHLDILVNNAGYLPKSPFLELSESEWLRSYSVNLFGPVKLIRCLWPLLEKAHAAHVVNISSMGGVQGSVKFGGLSAYSSAKGALSILTECLAEEFKETTVNFNCLAFGAVRTEMLEEAFPGYDAPVDAHEMAAYVADFARQGHRFYRGKVLPVALSTP